MMTVHRVRWCHDDRYLSAAFVVALAQHPEAQRKLRQHIVSEDVGEQVP